MFGMNKSSGEDFVPFMTYNAKAGRWYRKGDETAGEHKQHDITNNFNGVFDLETIHTGWMLFASGNAPQFATQPMSMGPVGKPNDNPKWNEGVRLQVALPPELGGGTYELASAATSFLGPLWDLYQTLYQNDQSPAPAGKLPHIKMTGVNQTGSGEKTNYAPVLEFVGWVDRPESMPGMPIEPVASATAAAGTPAAATNQADNQEKAPPGPAEQAAAPAAAEAAPAFG